MTFPLQYHNSVRRSIPASIALLGTFLLPLFLVTTSSAQINSGSSSRSAHASSGPSSHTSTNSGVASSGKTSHTTNGPGHTNPHPQRNPATGNFYYPLVYAVPVPYTVDIDDNGAPGDDDPNYQGGPTIFDRRGSGPYSYIPSGPESPLESNTGEVQPADDTLLANDNSDPQPPPDPTILVFKDGHQLEVENYAIVSQTLYDLTRGHPRKIALADLDLPATEKQNDNRGVTFDLPSATQAN
jgi:hypothetical protein